MDNDARNRIRRAMLAKKATSPKVRGQYKRAVRAARLEQEARQQAEFGPRSARVRSGDAPPPVVPPPKRKSARWILVLAALPILLIFAVGAYALNVDHPCRTGREQDTDGAIAARPASGRRCRH